MDKNKKKIKRILKTAVAFTLALAFFCRPELAVYAASKKGDMSALTTQFDIFKNLIATIVSCIGIIISLWGISEFGMAMQGNDGMMQSHSFKRIAGGLVMVLAPQILTILT